MKLNNFKIKSLPLNKKISDGLGLNLTLSSRASGKWTYRYTFNGRAKEMGIGSYPELSIVDARQLALEKGNLNQMALIQLFKNSLSRNMNKKNLKEDLAKLLLNI